MIKSVLSTDPNPTVGDIEIVAYGETRVSLTFYAPAAGSVTLNTEPGFALGSGIVMVAGSAPVELRLTTHGEIVRKAWRAKYSAGGNPVSWIEAFG